MTEHTEEEEHRRDRWQQPQGHDGRSRRDRWQEPQGSMAAAAGTRRKGTDGSNRRNTETKDTRRPGEERRTAIPFGPSRKDVHHKDIRTGFTHIRTGSTHIRTGSTHIRTGSTHIRTESDQRKRSYAFTSISSLPMARIASQFRMMQTSGRHRLQEGAKLSSPLCIHTNTASVA